MLREHSKHTVFSATTCTQCCRQCHPDDRAHQTVKCSKECQLLHQPCGHPCTKMCHEECGLCMRGIPNVPLPCGHVAILLPCHMYVTHHLCTKCTACMTCSQFQGIWGSQLQKATFPLHAVMQRCFHTLHVTCEASLYKASSIFANSANATAVLRRLRVTRARRKLQWRCCVVTLCKSHAT